MRAAVEQPASGGDCQATTGGVTGDRRVTQVQVRRDGVVQRSRIGLFGRQAIRGRLDDGVRGLGEVRGDRTVREWRAGRVAATVQVQHRTLAYGCADGYALGRMPAQRGVPHDGPPWQGLQPCARLQQTSLHREGQVGVEGHPIEHLRRWP